jgi:hypothetical protein
VNPRRTLDAADHGGPGEALAPHELYDGLVQRFAVPSVRLPDEAPTPAPRLPSPLAAAGVKAPSSSRKVSSESVENVVYAPRNPINRAERSHGAMVNRSARRVNRNPSTRRRR